MSIIRFCLAIIVIIIAFKVVEIFDDKDEQAKYNACREKGGTVWYCVTGVK